MKTVADTPISVESSPDGGTLYRFPTRPKGKFAGLFAVLFGAVFAGLFGFSAVSIVLNGIGSSNPTSWTGWLFPLLMLMFLSVFVLFGSASVLSGLTALFGRTSVRVTRDELIATDRVLILRYRRRQPLDPIRRFEVNVGTTSTNGGAKKPMENFAFLMAQTDAFAQAVAAKRKPKGGVRAVLQSVIAWGYPRDWLRPLADELAQHCNAESHRSLVIDDEGSAPVGVIETVGSDDPDADEAGRPYVPERPPNATADVTELHPGLSITLPARGIRRAGKGTLGFAFIWLSFTAIFTVSDGPLYSSNPGVWPALGITGLFAALWAVGLGVFISALNAGKRRGVIDVIGDTLLVTKQSLFKPTQFEWTADQLDDVRLGPTGTEINGKPINCLLVTPKDGSPVKLFAEREDNEIRWLAALLRRELALHQR
ncbi:MAG: hypothetical protein AAF797_16520 [Planctomycetota bacterium]